MNQIILIISLVAVITIAGVFAFLPVEKASTVHGSFATPILGTQLSEAGTISTDMFSNDLSGDTITITSTTDFVVFCQLSNDGVGATTFTIADSGDGSATNTFDVVADDNHAFSWAGDAGDTITVSAAGALEGLCTALTTSNGAITFG